MPDDLKNGLIANALLLEQLKLGQLKERLPVLDNRRDAIGSLCPVTVTLANDHSVLEDLCRWRAANMERFFTVFEPSIEKTRAYLVKLSLPDPARILFVIEDNRGRRVGNIGLCNITDVEAEVDNVIRGEPVEHRNFMLFVQWSLADWAFNTLNLSSLHLDVLADNERAVASYKRAGFVASGRHPLTKTPIPGGYQFVPAAEGTPEQAAFLRMHLDRSSLQDARAATA